MTEESDKLLLSEKIATKMCHDLSGISMTVANSLEMLGDGADDAFRKTAIDIAMRGAAGLPAKIKFFRVAFGSLGQNDISNQNLKVLLGDYLKSISEKAKMFLSEDMSLTAKEAKIIFNVIIFAVSMTSSLFTLDLSRQGDFISLKIQNGKNFILPSEISITDANVRFSELTPNNSSLFLGGILAGQYGKKMKININDDVLLLMLE